MAPTLVALIASVVTSVGVQLINVIANRRRANAEAGKIDASGQHVIAKTVDQLGETALDLVQQAQRDVASARADAREAREEASSSRRQAVAAERAAVDARSEAMDIATSMRRLVNAILSPYATIESLRMMVNAPPQAGPYPRDRPPVENGR